MDAVFYGFTVMLFAAVILMIEGSYLWWSGTRGGGAKRIARRLRLMSGGIDAHGEKVSILKQRRFCDNDWLDAFLQRRRLAQAIDRLLLQSGMRWSVAQFIGAALGSMCLSILLLQMHPVPPLAQLIVALMFLSVPYVLARRARAARLIKIEEQLPEAADFLARAMRAGHSFTNVLQMVGTELPEPLAGEFRAAHEEINYGVPLNEALYSLADRIPLTDLRYLVIAVVIQRESGGNLAELLDNVARMTRARLQLLAQVRVMSAEGRMSAWILTLMPLGLMAAMQVTNPKYSGILWQDPRGQHLLWYAACAIVAGMLWMRSIVKVRV